MKGSPIIEIKINKEIREYTESMFFGLSLRQFTFSVLACAVAVALYFLLRNRLSTETLSWLCIVAAVPFTLMGFVRYNGMTAERFLWAWLKSELLSPRCLVFRSENVYQEMLKEVIKKHENPAQHNET